MVSIVLARSPARQFVWPKEEGDLAMKRLPVLSLLLAGLMALAACAPAATPTLAPTVAPPTPAPIISTVVVTQQVQVPATVVVVVTATGVPATQAPTNTPAPTPVAQVPPDALAQKGKLLICTDFPYPPQEFFDDSGNPQGLDVEIGTGIANRLALQAQFVNSIFDTIIAAVKSGKCDIIISAQNITADRQKSVNMIAYFRAGQSMVAAKGNPQNINGPLDLCGKSAAAESGTTEADYLQGTGDYKGKGVVQQCTAAGKKAVDVVVTQKDTDALQQLQAGKVAVYFADSPVAAYYTVQHPDQFQVVGEVIQPADEGISVPCGQDDCSKAPLTPLGQAVQTALKSMMTDGTYGKILTKWNLSSGAVTSQ
jgi:polar amino acid transport system substrate-binding protein